MARLKYTKERLYAAESVMLDPIDCGSAIQFRIGRSKWGRLWGTIELRDCSRTIAWELPVGGTRAADKLRKAISALHRASREWHRAELAEKRRRRRK
jgi:hypothetical protein